MARPTWDNHFLSHAQVAAEMATCARAQHGCVLVQNKQILTIGFNGAPPGEPHCLDVGCKLVSGHCLRCRHAEFNAVLQAAERRISLKGATAYVTGTPCDDCAKVLIRENVARVIVIKPYGKSTAPAMFAEAGIEFVCLEAEINV